jgi:predicted HicB family RNase H-like nuclease
MAKKSFKDNLTPAMQFISTPVEERPQIDAPPEGYKVNPQYIEKKTRRLQLVLQPSLYERVKARAEQSGSSVNDYIHSILEEATREE